MCTRLSSNFVFFLLAIAYLCGCIFSFIPLMISEKLVDLDITTLSTTLNSKWVIYALVGSLSACSYAIVEEFFDLLFTFARRNTAQSFFIIVLLLTLIVPHAIFLIIDTTLINITVITCLNSFQMISIYLSVCAILYHAGQPVWDRHATFVAIPLLVAGVELRLLASCSSRRISDWLWAVPLVMALALVYFQAIKWCWFLYQSKISGIKSEELLFSAYLVAIFFYTVICMGSTDGFFQFGFDQTLHVKQFCTRIYNNTALVLIFIISRNQFTKRKLEKQQVISSCVLHSVTTMNTLPPHDVVERYRGKNCTYQRCHSLGMLYH